MVPTYLSCGTPMASIVDLRSDTVTRPTPAMRDAMFAAPLGDDVFGDDPSVNALQDYAAELLGKERALFVPSGTMANQLAIRAQTQPGDEVVVHYRSHIFNYEGGGASALSGVSIRTFDSTDGTLPMGVVDALHLGDDPHFAPTTLLAYENTHNGCGGVIAPSANIDSVTAAVRTAAKRAGKPIRLHLDGARFFNAHVGSGDAVKAMAAPFDTVSLCLSKGLGAPVGSVLVGDATAIQRAYRFRKMYGGGMRQAGVLAGAGLYALKHHVARLADDHRRARALAETLASLTPVEVDLERVQSNLVYFDIDPAHPMAERSSDGTPKLVGALAERGVLITGSYTRYRAVTHLDVDDDGLAQTVDAMRALLS